MGTRNRPGHLPGHIEGTAEGHTLAATRSITLTPQAAARRAIRDADVGYRAVTADAKALLDGVRHGGSLSLEGLNRLHRRVLALCNSIDYSQLLESLQMVRFDRAYYHYHVVNVALLNAMIGSELGMRGERLDKLVRLGLVLDLGMLRLPDKILNGTGQLSDTERLRIRLHPKTTEQILIAAGERDKNLLSAVALHHERFDGGGYPMGLKAEDIPLEARIAAVADSFDAAINRKGYKQAKSPFLVLAEFKQAAGGQLDPHIVALTANSLGRMMVGRHVRLSDHSIGKVVDVDPENLAYPLVRIVGRDVQTGPQLYPVSLSGHVPLFGER